MKYAVRINKRVGNVHVYKIVKKTSGNVNILTKIFLKVFSGHGKKEKEEKMQV